MRITFSQVRQSRIPAALGLCVSDEPRLLSFINEAQQRLINAGGETGWYGGWYRTQFSVSANNTIALDRYIARVINVAVCENPVGIENEFYEFVEAGVGPQSDEPCNGACGCSTYNLIDRGVFPTQVPISGSNKRLRVYASDARDYGKRVLFSGKDANDRIVRTLDAGYDYNGEFVTLAAPFSDTISVFSNELIGAQKDITVGDVLVYTYDIVTGDEDLIALFDARDTTPAFRRYYVNGLATGCCPGTCTQVEGLAKLEYVPVERDTDFLIIGNIPALKEECQSIRYSEMDSPASDQMADIKHKRAIRLLQNELVHYMGNQKVTVNLNCWGTAKLENQSIGVLI